MLILMQTMPENVNIMQLKKEILETVKFYYFNNVNNIIIETRRIECQQK